MSSAPEDTSPLSPDSLPEEQRFEDRLRPGSSCGAHWRIGPIYEAAKCSLLPDRTLIS